MNFPEQLAAEWYEYSGYFVRTNVRCPRPMVSVPSPMIASRLLAPIGVANSARGVIQPLTFPAWASAYQFCA